HKVIRTVARLIGFMMIFYSFYGGTGTERLIGAGIGVLIIGIASSIKQKHMLMITGAGVLTGGISLEETWLMLMGVYIILASFVAHCSYTNYIVDVVYFSVNV